MCAAAELDAVLEAPRSGLVRQQRVDLRANAHHANRVRVCLTENRPEAVDGLGLVKLHLLEAHGVGLLNLLVHNRLDLEQLVVLDRLAVREVEAQLELVDKRSLLVDLVAQHLPQREVQDMRSSVVLCNQRPPHVIHLDIDGVSDLQRAGLDAANMEDVASKLLGIITPELGTACRNGGHVEDLTALLRIARCLVKDDANDLAGGVALLNEVLAIVDGHDLGRMLGAVSLGVPRVLERLVRRGNTLLGQGICLRSLQLHVLAVLEGPTLLGLLLELLHLCFKSLHVDRHLGLLAHELREINREAVAGEQQEGVLAGDVALLRTGAELADALVQSPAKLLFLLLDDGLHVVHVLLERGEGITQRSNDAVHQGVEEAWLRLENLAPVTHGTSQDAAKDVATAVVRWNCSICERYGQSADVVGDHSICHVHKVSVSLADLAGVGPCTSLLLDRSEDAGKDISVVVAPLVHENGRHTLEAHARVNALGRELGEAAVGLTVELHEYVVPNLKNIRVVQVDQGRSISATNAIVVNLCARTARASVTHLPEVVLHVEGQDLALRQVLLPDVPSLVVRRHIGLLRVATVVRRVQTIGVDLVDLGQQLPCPADGLLLEVIAEGPIPQHLEKGVVVHILAHIFQVVVLATRPDALLRVRCSLELRKWVAGVDLANENRLELVHASIDEEQGGIVVRHNR
mmetsp:Transcript_30041/g.68240  ORF Transcript_30041/g.68240 Transcript_30041/m.68240 type:complete len:689 (-) Transcript_30041:287-2353(-)